MLRFDPAFENEIIPILKKDSLDLTDEDREKILNVCLDSISDKIIITHGTDTMLETGQFIEK